MKGQVASAAMIVALALKKRRKAKRKPRKGVVITFLHCMCEFHSLRMNFFLVAIVLGSILMINQGLSTLILLLRAVFELELKI